MLEKKWTIVRKAFYDEKVYVYAKPYLGAGGILMWTDHLSEAWLFMSRKEALEYINLQPKNHGIMQVQEIDVVS